jgi:hypothetical protein
MKSPIVNEVEINGSKFFVRGLLVGEYLNLVISKKIANSESFYVKLPKLTVLGWEGVTSTQYTKPLYELMELPEWPNIPSKYVITEEVEFSQENIGNLDYNTLLELGKIIFENFTMLSEEEVNYFQGSTRFLHFLSLPENRSKADRYDCHTCIKKNYRNSRVCNKFTDDEANHIKYILSDGEDEEFLEDSEEPKETNSKELKNKYKHVKNKRMVFKGEREEPEIKVKKGAVKINGFIFEECPVSWIPDWVNTLSGVFYHCTQSNIPFFSGGVCDQPYKFYRAERIVAGENSKIDREEMEKNNKKNNKGSGRR